MEPVARSGANKTVLFVVLGLAAACVVCSVGVVVLGGIGMFFAKAPPAPPVPVATAQPDTVRFEPPAPFEVVSEGRYRAEKNEDGARHIVEVIRLPALEGIGDPIEALNAEWKAVIVRDWPGAPERVVPLRRFANNGARVYFSSASLKQEADRWRSLVTLYLVQADTRFEPFVTVQSFSGSSAGAEFQAQYSSGTSHPLVEELFKGIAGSPAGLPLVDDAEVVGRWKYSSGNQLHFVNVLTGTSGFTAVSSAISWSFDEGHDFTYEFSGAVTNTGATDFATQTDTGTWQVEHDVLITDGKTLKRKFFVVGAGLGPNGKRTLYLMPEGKWTLSPGALGRDGALYEEE